MYREVVPENILTCLAILVFSKGLQSNKISPSSQNRIPEKMKGSKGGAEKGIDSIY